MFGILGKKKWDLEKSDTNKKQMRLLFDQVVKGGESYQLAYGLSQTIKTSNYVLASKTTYTYTSLIIGFREEDMSLVILQTTPLLEGCSDPTIFKKGEIKKAKVTAGSYTVYHEGGLFAGYTQFNVMDYNDDNVLAYVHQPEEAQAFADFWKKFSGK